MTRGPARCARSATSARADGDVGRAVGRHDLGDVVVDEPGVVGADVTLGALIGSGIALTTLHGGPRSRGSCACTASPPTRCYRSSPSTLAIGVLPGYRGAWRSMHLGGRTPNTAIERLWPRPHLVATTSARTSARLPTAKVRQIPRSALSDSTSMRRSVSARDSNGPRRNSGARFRHRS